MLISVWLVVCKEVVYNTLFVGLHLTVTILESLLKCGRYRQIIVFYDLGYGLAWPGGLVLIECSTYVPGSLNVDSRKLTGTSRSWEIISLAIAFAASISPLMLPVASMTNTRVTFHDRNIIYKSGSVQEIFLQTTAL